MTELQKERRIKLKEFLIEIMAIESKTSEDVVKKDLSKMIEYGKLSTPESLKEFFKRKNPHEDPKDTDWEEVSLLNQQTVNFLEDTNCNDEDWVDIANEYARSRLLGLFVADMRAKLKRINYSEDEI